MAILQIDIANATNSLQRQDSEALCKLFETLLETLLQEKGKDSIQFN